MRIVFFTTHKPNSHHSEKEHKWVESINYEQDEKISDLSQTKNDF